MSTPFGITSSTSSRNQRLTSRAALSETATRVAPRPAPPSATTEPNARLARSRSGRSRSPRIVCSIIVPWKTWMRGSPSGAQRPNDEELIIRSPGGRSAISRRDDHSGETPVRLAQRGGCSAGTTISTRQSRASSARRSRSDVRSTPPVLPTAGETTSAVRLMPAAERAEPRRRHAPSS